MLKVKILSLIYLIFGLFLFSCAGLFGDAYDPGWSVYLRYSPVHIYVDENIDDTRQDLIEKALKSWEQATDHSVEFIIHKKAARPHHKNFDLYSPVRGDGIYLWYITENDKEYISKKVDDGLDRLNGVYIPGSTENEANIIIFGRSEMNSSDTLFYNVVLHETGHLLGLDHSKHFNAIMYPYSNYMTCITTYDAEEICKLYKCEPRPQC